MKRILFLAALCLASSSAAAAAEVFGTVSENGKPLPQGVALKLDCGNASVSGATDQFGSYSLKAAAAGDCRLTLTYKGSSPSLKVTVYEKPSRYDLVVKEEAGKMTIARK
jgi:opacity protein-like surface antigen